MIISRKYGLVSVSGRSTFLKEDTLEYHKEWVEKITKKYGPHSEIKKFTKYPPESEAMIWRNDNGRSLGEKVIEIRLILTKGSLDPFFERNPNSWDLSLGFKFENVKKWKEDRKKKKKDAF
jgi:hypothetical protein